MTMSDLNDWELTFFYSAHDEYERVVALSPHKRQIAMLLVEGKSAKEMARILDISPRIVDAHRARLMMKYNARSTAALMSKLSALQI